MVFLGVEEKWRAPFSFGDSVPFLWNDLSFFPLPFLSYGRVYTADPYHALAPAASYGVGAVVSITLFVTYVHCGDNTKRCKRVETSGIPITVLEGER